MEKVLKTPISYYGGKQQMLRHILPLIPNHKVYVEPFCGGAAVYWSKAPSEIEIINDLNDELINFYRILQTRFNALSKVVKSTLHSRKLHRTAWEIYNHPGDHDEIARAWALWTLCTQSFASKISGSWGYDRSNNTMAKKVTNKKHQFTAALSHRLEFTQIDCRKALEVIRIYDQPEAFIYCDPPYPETNQGHYGGYSMDDLRDLLTLLSTLKGKFMLSNYPQDIINDYAKEHGWYQREFKMPLCASKKAVRRSKIEVLTTNYPI